MIERARAITTVVLDKTGTVTEGRMRVESVVGAADAVRGQVVVASVVLRDGATATAAELLTHCQEQLVPHKAPRTIRFVAEIPKQPTGKAIRRLLRTDDR